jgi:hypothetical protein
MGELLGYRADDLDVDGFGEPCQLFQGVGGCPGLMLTLDGDQEGMFGWAVGGMWRAWNGNLLSVFSGSGGLFIVLPGTRVVMLMIDYVPLSRETIGATISSSVSLTTK